MQQNSEDASIVSNILLLGDYSGNNAGHNALLLSVVKELNSVLRCNIVVPTISPRSLKKVLSGHDSIRILGVAPWNLSIKFLGLPVFRAVRETDCILLTDNLFYDSSFLNLFKNNLIALLFITLAAKKYRKPLIYYNSGVGPVRTAAGKKCVQWISRRLDLITVRDIQSKILLDNIAPGVSSIVTADSGFNIMKDMNNSNRHREVSRAEGTLSIREKIGLNISYHYLDYLKNSRHAKSSDKESLYQISSSLRNIFRKTDYGIVFFVTHPRDREITHSIADRIESRDRVEIIDCEGYPLHSIINTVSEMKCVIGTRYHEMVMFAAVGIPVIGIDCGDKMQSLFESLGLENHLIDPFQLINEKGQDMVIELLNSSADTKQYVENKIATQKEASMRSVSLLLEKGYIRHSA